MKPNPSSSSGGREAGADANAVIDHPSIGSSCSPPASRREIIALQLMRFECDSQGDWPMDKVRALLAAIGEPHSGDCRKQPWTCCRCVAEDVYRVADAIDEALK